MNQLSAATIAPIIWGEKQESTAAKTAKKNNTYLYMWAPNSAAAVRQGPAYLLDELFDEVLKKTRVKRCARVGQSMRWVIRN